MRAMRQTTQWGACVALLVALAVPVGASGASTGRGASHAGVAPAAPVVLRLSARPGKTGALLKARIRPEGLTTTYRFYLELCTGSECIDEVLVGEGTTAASSKAQTVQASTYSVFDEPGLPPGSTWEYSVVATNLDGSTRLGKTFKTHR